MGIVINGHHGDDGDVGVGDHLPDHREALGRMTRLGHSWNHPPKPPFVSAASPPPENFNWFDLWQFGTCAQERELKVHCSLQEACQGYLVGG